MSGTDPSLSSIHPRPLHHSSRSLNPARLIGKLLLNRYVATSVLASGGMGCVLSGHDVQTGELVALKVVAPKAYSAENIARFRREAKTSAALQHPHLIRVFGSGTLPDGSPVLAMELLNGQTLSARLKERGPLSLAEAARVALELLDALSFVHRAGIVHRDVKPGNVFLCHVQGAPPRVKLIDFGVAKVLPSCEVVDLGAEQRSLTRTDMIPGTPQYLAPEQLLSKPVDVSVDVWAAGLTIYEALAGKKAYLGKSRERVVKHILFGEHVSIEKIRPDVPVEIAAVLARATAKDRTQRYPTADAFREAFLHAWSKHRAQGLARSAARLELGAPPRRPTSLTKTGTLKMKVPPRRNRPI
jgi:serine/threonine-protein kinase